MFRVAAITDEIGNGIEPALALLAEWKLSDAEIHTLWDTSIERLGPDQVSHLRQLLTGYGLHACMLSSTIFLRCRVGHGPPPESWDRRFDSIGGTYIQHVAALARCLEIASELDAPMIRVFGFWPEEGDQARVTAEVVSRLATPPPRHPNRGSRSRSRTAPIRTWTVPAKCSTYWRPWHHPGCGCCGIRRTLGAAAIATCSASPTERSRIWPTCTSRAFASMAGSMGVAPTFPSTKVRWITCAFSLS